MWNPMSNRGDWLRCTALRAARIARATAPIGVALALVLALPAAAQVASKVKKDQGRFIAFDPQAETVTVKVEGKETVFQVKSEGSVLKRTTVSMNATPATLADLPSRAPVIVYWVPCDDKGASCKVQDGKQRFARKIDAPRIPKEFLDDLED
jgi:hypothetical protein